MALPTMPGTRSSGTTTIRTSSGPSLRDTSHRGHGAKENRKVEGKVPDQRNQRRRAGGDCTASTTTRCSSGSYGCSRALMDAGGTEHTSACAADFSRSPSCSCPNTTGVQVVDRHTSEESIQRHFAGGCATGNENDPSQKGKEQNKELNQAVKGLRKARKELQDSFEARSQLHMQCRALRVNFKPKSKLP